MAAGLPVERGLRLIAQESGSRRMTAAIGDIANQVERGTSLGEAFNARRGQFPPLYGQLIDAGIASRNLPGMLFNLGRHMELIHRLRAAIWHAAAYPMIVFGGILGVVLFLQLFILPQFVEIFDDFDTSLPWVTEVLIATGRWMPQVLIALLALIILFPFIWRVLRATGWDQWVADGLCLPLPLIGPVLKRGLIARWCDTVRLGVDAGLDLPKSIRLAANALGSPLLRADGERLINSIESGTTAAKGHPLSVLPHSVITAIDLSSNQDTLSTALGALTDLYRQQAELRIGVLGTILVPILLVLIGLTIGGVCIALMLPLIKLMQSVM